MPDGAGAFNAVAARWSRPAFRPRAIVRRPLRLPKVPASIGRTFPAAGVHMVAGSGGVGRGGQYMLGSVSFAVRGCALRIAFHGLLAIASMAASMVPAAAPQNSTAIADPSAAQL